MKGLLLLLTTFSLTAYANEEMELKLLKLEKRIKQLEKKQGGASGLKTIDYKNSNINAGNTVLAQPQLSEEEKAKLMEQIKIIKKNQAAQKEILDEIMNED